MSFQLWNDFINSTHNNLKNMLLAHFMLPDAIISTTVLPLKEALALFALLTRKKVSLPYTIIWLSAYKCQTCTLYCYLWHIFDLMLGLLFMIIVSYLCLDHDHYS